MKTIATKYLGPTTCKGSRYKATDGDNTVIVSADGVLSDTENHKAAVLALANKLGWNKEGHYAGRSLIGGYTKTGMVWVFTRGAEFVTF